jgi:Uma2 family endonuclease
MDTTTALKLPDSLEADDFLRLPATWEQYLAVVADTPYTLQFLDGEVLGSQADVVHESLVARLGWMLGNHYADVPDYWPLGSNIKIAVSEGYCDVNADLSVIKHPVDYGRTPTGRLEDEQITNPEIVVEVLSKSTRKFDQGEKLAEYKLIPSLQHILFVDQTKPFASVYSRTDNADEWLNQDYRTLESVVRLGELTLPMQDIYRKTVFAS